MLFARFGYRTSSFEADILSAKRTIHCASERRKAQPIEQRMTRRVTCETSTHRDLEWLWLRQGGSR